MSPAVKGSHTPSGEAVHARIKRFFEDYPQACQSDCASVLDLDKSTVGKHVKRLRAEGMTIVNKHRAGDHGREIGDKNREAVRRYFAQHMGCTILECAEALDLGRVSVARHLQVIRREWDHDAKIRARERIVDRPDGGSDEDGRP